MKRKPVLLILVLSFSLFLVFPMPERVQALYEDWLDRDYRWRTPFNVTTTPNAGNNYPIKITVRNGSSANGNGVIYLDNLTQSDFDDVRFTSFSANTTALNYWIEEVADQDYAVFWVNVTDSLSASEARLFIYYGNSDCGNASDGETVFSEFTQFDDEAVPSGWTQYKEHSSVTPLTFTANTVVVDSNWSSKVLGLYTIGYSDNTAARFRWKAVGTAGWSLAGFNEDYTSSNAIYRNDAARRYDPDANFSLLCGDGTNSLKTDMGIAADVGTWHISESARNDSSNTQLTIGTTTKTNTYDKNIARHIWIADRSDTGSYFEVDWALARTYRYPEPYATDWGTEEELLTSVELNEPDGVTLNNWPVAFNYTPYFPDWFAPIENASLWHDESGTFQHEVWNASAITNEAKNTISYTFTSEGTYTWNVRVSNSTTSIFASANRTVTVDKPPRIQNVSPGNGTEINQGDNILLSSQGYDGIGLDWGWLETNETGTMKNYTWEEDYAFTYSSPRFVYGNDSVVSDGWPDIDPDIYVADNGSVILAFTHQKPTWERWFCMSNDNGVSWGSPKNFSVIVGGSTNATNIGRFGSVRKHPDGTYILFQKFSNDTLWSFQSTDGFTWENVAEVYDGSGVTIGLPMGHILANNDTVCVWTDYDAYTLYLNKSTDQGGSWSKLSNYLTNSSYGYARYGQIDQFPNTTIILSWYHNTEETWRAVTSNDNGSTWGTEFILYADDRRSFGFEVLTLHENENDEYYIIGRHDQGEDGNRRLAATRHKASGYWIDEAAVDGMNLETEPHFYKWNNTNYLWAFRANTDADGVGSDHDIYVFDLTVEDTSNYGAQSLEGAHDAWTWANFTWNNASVSMGSDILVRRWFNDTNGNVNCSDFYYFNILKPDTFIVYGTFRMFMLAEPGKGLQTVEYEQIQLDSSEGASKALGFMLGEQPRVLAGLSWNKALLLLVGELMQIVAVLGTAIQIAGTEYSFTFYETVKLWAVDTMAKSLSIRVVGNMLASAAQTVGKSLGRVLFGVLVPVAVLEPTKALLLISAGNFTVVASQAFLKALGFISFESVVAAAAQSVGKSLLLTLGEVVKPLANLAASLELLTVDMTVVLMEGFRIVANLAQTKAKEFTMFGAVRIVRVELSGKALRLFPSAVFRVLGSVTASLEQAGLEFTFTLWGNLRVFGSAVAGKALSFQLFGNVVVSAAVSMWREFLQTLGESMRVFSAGLEQGKSMRIVLGGVQKIGVGVSPVLEVAQWLIVLFGSVVVSASLSIPDLPSVVAALTDMEIVMVAFALILPWVMLALMVGRRQRPTEELA